MITLNVFPPNADGAKFDMNYLPHVAAPECRTAEFGSALKSSASSSSCKAALPGTKAEFAVLCHLRFRFRRIVPAGDAPGRQHGELDEAPIVHTQQREGHVLISF